MKQRAWLKRVNSAVLVLESGSYLVNDEIMQISNGPHSRIALKATKLPRRRDLFSKHLNTPNINSQISKIIMKMKGKKPASSGGMNYVHFAV